MRSKGHVPPAPSDIIHPAADEAKQAALLESLLEHRPSLLRFLAAKLGCQHQAGRIADATYAKLRLVDLERETRCPTAFLFTTAAALAISHIRTRDRAPDRATAAAVAPSETPPALPPSEAAVGDCPASPAAATPHFMAALTAHCRQSLLLRRLERLMTPAATADMFLREAAGCFVMIHDEDASTEDFIAWQRWLARSPDHRAAFQRIEEFWNAGSEQTPDAASPTADFSATAGRRNAPRWLIHARQRLPRGPVMAAAAGIAAASLLAAIWLVPAARSLLVDPTAAASAPTRIATRLAEHKHIALPDGSQLAIGAASLVSVSYSRRTRNLSLDHGEAFFTVSPNPKRPFIVRAGTGTITAIGTAFNIRHIGANVAVTVLDGTVAVTDATNTTTRAAKGTRIRYRGDLNEPAAIEPVHDLSTAADADTAAPAWLTGRLVYRGESLELVLADVSRYTTARLIMDDPTLGELRYTGTVLVNQVNDWLATLPDIFPIEIVREADGTVLIRSRSADAQSNSPPPTPTAT